MYKAKSTAKKTYFEFLKSFSCTDLPLLRLGLTMLKIVLIA